MIYKTRRGFTLIELLVVIGIIAVMAAVIFPMMASARRDARRAVSISNLHQCGLALLMYCDDNGGIDAMPSGTEAAQLLKNIPTCDPNDTWRKNCSEDFGLPMIGSYGYVRGTEQYATLEQWKFWRNFSHNQTLMASLFYADNVPLPFHGNDIMSRLGPACGITQEKCMMPDRVLRLRLDGSVAMARFIEPPATHFLASWSNIFFDDDPIVYRKNS